MNNRKAIGPDQIPAKPWKALDGDDIRLLTLLFNFYFKQRENLR